MPAKGWMNIRGLPESKSMTIQAVLKYFFKYYEVCGGCEGVGYILDDSVVDLLPDTTCIKYSGFPDLEKMNKDNKLTSDTIKKIVETVSYHRKSCIKCKGFGFVKKSRKTKNGKKAQEE